MLESSRFYEHRAPEDTPRKKEILLASKKSVTSNQAPSTTSAKLRKAVNDLTDLEKWSWTSNMGSEAAAELVLDTLAKLGLIKKHKHRYGGFIYQVGNVLYGRIDDIMPEKLKKGVSSGKLKIGRANPL